MVTHHQQKSPEGHGKGIVNDSSPPNRDVTQQRAPPVPTCTELLAKTLPRYSQFNAARMTKRRSPPRSGRLTVILFDIEDESEVKDALNRHHVWL
jgi:hypothetical protein